MSVLIVGSTALDSIKTPHAENPRLLGGSASHAAVAASFFSPTRLVGITEQPSAAPTVIYLTRAGDADYRIFVSSKNFTLREAAALIVGAQSERQIVTSKAL